MIAEFTTLKDINETRLGTSAGQYATNPNNSPNMVLLFTFFGNQIIKRVEIDDDNRGLWATDAINKPLGVALMNAESKPGQLLNQANGEVLFAVASGGQFALILNATGTILPDNEIFNFRFYFVDGTVYSGSGNHLVELAFTEGLVEVDLLNNLKTNSTGLTYISESDYPFEIKTVQDDLPSFTTAEFLEAMYPGQKPVKVTGNTMSDRYNTTATRLFMPYTDSFRRTKEDKTTVYRVNEFDYIKWRRFRDSIFDNLDSVKLWRVQPTAEPIIDVHITGRHIRFTKSLTNEITPIFGNVFVISTKSVETLLPENWLL